MKLKNFLQRFFRRPIPYILSWPQIDRKSFQIQEINKGCKASLNSNSAKESAEKYLALLCDSKARVGSGVVVGLEDGRLAVLSARHVVLNLIMDGEFHIVIPHIGLISIEPASIRVLPRNDLALVFIKHKDTSIPSIPWDKWNPNEERIDINEQIVYATGHPAEWKGKVFLKTKSIKGLISLGVWANTQKSIVRNQCFQIDCDFSGMPKSLEGLSGGPVFLENGELAAIITHQSLEGKKYLLCYPIKEAKDLVVPYTPSINAPVDLYRQKALAITPVCFRGQLSHVAGVFEHFESQNQPSHPEGLISRLSAIISFSNNGSKRYIINVENILYPSSSSPDDLQSESFQELSLLFNSTTIKPLEDGPIPSTDLIKFAKQIMDKL